MWTQASMSWVCLMDLMKAKANAKRRLPTGKRRHTL
jgi:hypothetical protein